ncbi:unnamed protein product [Ceutorhynchus assimilis]|uniref:Protein aurora borealis n=1 Tax=Ceutorhynchus assimilis TaxID=467358 RepID=A0A9P0DER8_9CUCU|nr:unnamed protein product [Ceutorhynchus assimilis]
MMSENVKSDSKSHKHKTPSPKTKINKFYKQISGMGGSPFKNLPNFSTPPSKSAIIFNPFEPHLFERLHLPTCSPDVFEQISTSKTEENFKWSIDDISILKPADIDESSLSQHVVTEDPHIESMVQEKICKFFSENKIVPSPLNAKVQQSFCLVRESLGVTPEKYVNTDEQCIGFSMDDNASFYKELFEFEDNEENSAEVKSLSPPAAISGDLGIPALLFSPTTRGFGTPELNGSALSPITKTLPLPTRFSFSDDMSIDISVIEVSDKDNQLDISGNEVLDKDDQLMLTTCTPMKKTDTTFGKNADCSMVSSFSSSCTDSDKMDVSHSYTPRSKLFTRKKQRKRLSKSFRSQFEVADKNTSLPSEDQIFVEKGKMLENDTTDVGYCTHDTGDYSNNYCANVFASTPSSKRTAILDF